MPLRPDIPTDHIATKTNPPHLGIDNATFTAGHATSGLDTYIDRRKAVIDQLGLYLMDSPPTQVTVDLSDLTTVILLWRSTQEAPGGTPAWKACQDMREAMWGLEHSIREQTGRTSEGVEVDQR